MSSFMWGGVTHIDAKFDSGMANQVVIGLITLSTDVVTEYEMREMLPQKGVSISATRIKTHNPMTVSHLEEHAEEIAKAGELFDPPESVDVFAYACTSGSAIISQPKLERELHRTIPGSKLTSPMTGALRGFEKLGVKRIAMLTPYPDDVTAAVVRCLDEKGVTVANAASFHIENDFDVIRISPESMISAVRETDTSDAQAFFIPCTGFRTSKIIERMEAVLGKPVITAHQAMLWDALRLAGSNERLSGLGKLFAI